MDSQSQKWSHDLTDSLDPLLTLVAAALTVAFVRYPAASGVPERAPNSTLEELSVLRRPQFVLALLSSTLIIGATFSAFSFFTPILTEVTGFSESAVPLLLLAYGAATLVGNMAVARLADRHTTSTLLAGTGLNVLFLAGFALFTDVQPLALVFVLGIGLVGVPVVLGVAMAVLAVLAILPALGMWRLSGGDGACCRVRRGR